MITPELLGLMPSSSSANSDGENNSRSHMTPTGAHHGSKSWTQEDMDAALDALRNHDMSLTKASGNYQNCMKKKISNKLIVRHLNL